MGRSFEHRLLSHVAPVGDDALRPTTTIPVDKSKLVIAHTNAAENLSFAGEFGAAQCQFMAEACLIRR